MTFLYFRQCVELWLERTPGLDENGFNFPAKYKAAVEAIFEQELEIIKVLLSLRFLLEKPQRNFHLSNLLKLSKMK